jgi:hypothetical protein
MPSKNFNLPYLHDVNTERIDLCDDIAKIVDAIDEHLATAEIPQEDALQTPGLYYTKVGELVTVYGTCTPTAFLVAKLPFKPVLHSGALNMPLVAYKTNGMAPLSAALTGEGSLVCNGGANNEIMIQFTYATLD